MKKDRYKKNEKRMREWEEVDIKRMRRDGDGDGELMRIEKENEMS